MNGIRKIFFSNFLKVADLEQKSENIQHLIIKLISNLLQVGNSLEIETPSFIFYFYKLNSSSLPTGFRLQNNQFQISSFCSLYNFNCSEQIISLKVNYFCTKYIYVTLNFSLKCDIMGILIVSATIR
jgi:hypothetical protein